MQMLLKQSTAITVTILMIDSTSHYAGKTGLAAGLTIYATKAGGTPSAITPTVAELDATNAPGLYSLVLTTTHTNTLGELQLYITASGADPARVWYQIGNIHSDIQAWLGAAPNALISGRVDSNAQVVADKTQYTLTAGEHDMIPADIYDELAADHNTASTFGAKINSAGSAADPLNVTVPGSYGVGTVGYLIGTYLNAAISAVKAKTDLLTFTGTDVNSVSSGDSPGVTTLLGRLTSARAGYLDLLNTYLDLGITTIRTIVNAIKAKTDLLPAAPASETLIEAAITAAQGVITTQTDLIKAKTVNLPSSPAAVGSKMDLQDAPNATAITAIQSGLATASSITTVLNRLGAWTGSGANNILGAFRALLRKDVDAAAPTDINTNLGSGAGTFLNTDDSVEAIRDRGDSNWASGSIPSAATIASAVWDALRSAHTISGSFGEGVASVQGAITGAVASVTGAVGSVIGGMAGNVAGSVGSVVGSIGGTVPDSSGMTTLLTRLSATRAGYLDALAGWSGTLLNALKAMARKDATASIDIGGTHLPADDSEEAIREKINTLTSAGTTVIQDTTNELNT
jgi:hypothetical protein